MEGYAATRSGLRRSLRFLGTIRPPLGERHSEDRKCVMEAEYAPSVGSDCHMPLNLRFAGVRFGRALAGLQDGTDDHWTSKAAA